MLLNAVWLMRERTQEKKLAEEIYIRIDTFELLFSSSCCFLQSLFLLIFVVSSSIRPGSFAFARRASANNKTAILLHYGAHRRGQGATVHARMVVLRAEVPRKRSESGRPRALGPFFYFYHCLTCVSFLRHCHHSISQRGLSIFFVCHTRETEL